MIPGIIESARSVTPFTDTFNRTNSANIATDLYEWEELSGDWQINGNSAYTPTAPASYPIAVVDTKKFNNTTTVTNNEDKHGFGVAFWVKDVNNWWALVSDSAVSSGTYQYYYCSIGGYLSGTTCYTTITESYVRYILPGSCPANAAAYISNCICYDPGGCNCGGINCGGADSNYPGQYDCDAGSCAYYGYVWTGSYFQYVKFGDCQVVAPYTYPASDCGPVYGTITTDYAYAATLGTATNTFYAYYMKLLRNQSGTVSTVATNTHGTDGSDGNYFTSLSVTTTSAGNITMTGTRAGIPASFSTTGIPLDGSKQGMIMAPATRKQGSKIDQFQYVS